jgi:hypothetical protein
MWRSACSSKSLLPPLMSRFSSGVSRCDCLVLSALLPPAHKKHIDHARVHIARVCLLVYCLLRCPSVHVREATRIHTHEVMNGQTDGPENRHTLFLWHAHALLRAAIASCVCALALPRVENDVTWCVCVCVCVCTTTGLLFPSRLVPPSIRRPGLTTNLLACLLACLLAHFVCQRSLAEPACA